MIRIPRLLFSFVFGFIRCSVATTANCAALIPVGQNNDFQDGQLSNWQGGGAGMGFQSQSIVSTGGPSCNPGDQYALISAGGPPDPNNPTVTAGPRLLAVNDSQWLGDYSNITAITVDLMSPTSNATNGVNSLTMRLAVRNGTNNNSPGWVSTNADAFTLPSDGNWYNVTFMFDAADMQAAGTSPPTLSALKSNVLDFRILDATNAGVLVGDQFLQNPTSPVISFGMDNITAVPEPSALVLAAIAVGLIGVHKASKRKMGA